MILNLLRLLRGYVRFSVSGKYPERFINIALRNKIRLWEVVGSDGGLTACMYMRDYRRVRPYARNSRVRLRIRERHGLPVLLRRYGDRTGVAIGAAAFVLTVFVMSLFVWSIDIVGLESISESEMRAMLAENGLSVGSFRLASDYQSISRAVMLGDSRVGWMAINVTGSYASVEIKEESPSPEVSDVDTPCNVKAKRDGRILRIDAQEGTAAVKIGSGVVKGQVVVSGVTEGKLGDHMRLVRAKASVIAETSYSADFSVPKTVVTTVPTGEVKRRLTAELFGVRIPLTVGGVSTPEVLSDEITEAPEPLDVTLPASLLTRRLYALEQEETPLDNNSAEELLLKEARLYEVFSLSECTVTDRRYHLSDDGGGYTLKADYTCAENIAYQDEISVEKSAEKY